MDEKSVVMQQALQSCRMSNLKYGKHINAPPVRLWQQGSAENRIFLGCAANDDA